MIEWLAQIDPATWATVVAGLGSAGGALGGKWFGHRSAVRKIEAGAVARITDGYGEVLADLQQQLRDSRADRVLMNAKIDDLESAQRQERAERRVLAEQFDVLLEHVRVLRSILHANQIEHPPGPDFLNDGEATA